MYVGGGGGGRGIGWTAHIENTNLCLAHSLMGKGGGGWSRACFPQLTLYSPIYTCTVVKPWPRGGVVSNHYPLMIHVLIGWLSDFLMSF